MKNILLPTDFSKNSMNAVNYAINLFNKKECTFFILNVQKQSNFVLDDFMTEKIDASVHNTIAQDNKNKLKIFTDKIKKNHPNKSLNFKLLFDFDTLIHSIEETITSKNIDIVIMGTNGVTSAREIIFGSNTLNVIRKVASPILVIPENYQFKGIHAVLYSTENHKNYADKNLAPLKKFLKANETSLHILDTSLTNNFEKEESYQTYLNNLFEPNEYKYYKVEEVPLLMAVNTMNQLFGYDIHALFMESQTSFLERFLHNSETNEISYKTKTPLLVLRES